MNCPSLPPRVVQQYRHMGSWLDARHSLKKELQSRRGAPKAALKHLRRKAFCDHCIGQKIRWAFPDALCVSRLLTNSHTVSYSTSAERGSFHAAHLGIARTVSYKVTTPKRRAYFSDLILAYLGANSVHTLRTAVATNIVTVLAFDGVAVCDDTNVASSVANLATNSRGRC